MVLVSNIVIDNTAGTAVLSMMIGSDLVETITFQNSNNQVTFLERAELFISGKDFLDFMDQLKIFEVAILFNFNPNQFQTEPYSQTITTNTLDTGSGQWNLTVDSLGEPFIIEYSAILSTIMMMLHKRNNAKTIEFSEWITTLARLKNYQLQVRNYFSL